MKCRFFLQSAAVLALAGSCAGAQPASDDAPWAAQRSIEAFQFLLNRSPFSLPTAEESSPMAERYTLTGAVGVNGEAIVFILDKTTQSRQMVGKTPNAEKISLVEYLPDPDPRKMRATIRVDGQIATIAYSEPVANPNDSPQNSAMAPQNPSAVVVAAGSPPMPGTPGFQPGQPNQKQPVSRRVIRRRVITGQPMPGP